LGIGSLQDFGSNLYRAIKRTGKAGMPRTTHDARSRAGPLLCLKSETAGALAL